MLESTFSVSCDPLIPTEAEVGCSVAGAPGTTVFSGAGVLLAAAVGATGTVVGLVSTTDVELAALDSVASTELVASVAAVPLWAGVLVGAAGAGATGLITEAGGGFVAVGVAAGELSLIDGTLTER